MHILQKNIEFLRKISRKISSFFAHKPVSLDKKTVDEYNATRYGYSHRLICYAPFTNLFFGYEGKIGVCCYNRTHLLGIYPDTSIKEAWFGKSVLALREKIKKADLFSGCYGCYVQWSEKAYQTVLARNFDHLIPYGKYPKSMEFELSNRCNLSCIMCSEENSSSIAKQRHGAEERLKPYDDNFVKELEEFIPHLKHTKFLGGEPFLIPIYYDIWEAIIRRNPQCEILVQTNGTILNDKIKSLLKKGNFSINVSMDSINKDTFEAIRTGADFEKTYNNLLYFIDFCKKNNRYFSITACFIKQNWREIPELINFCNSYQIPITFNRVWAPPKSAIWGSSSEYIHEILQFFITQKFPENTQIEKANLQAFNDLISLLSNWKKEAELHEETEKVFFNTPTEVLEQKIIDLVIEIIKIKEPLGNDEIINKLKFFFEKYRNHPQYKTLLLKTLETPDEILYSQLKNNSFERLEQQVKDIIY